MLAKALLFSLPTCSHSAPPSSFAFLTASLDINKRVYIPPYGTVIVSPIAARRDYDDEPGNYWTNPPEKLDRYPIVSKERRRRNNGDSEVRERRAESERRNVKGHWWETKREENELDGQYTDDYPQDSYGTYGLPPPTRSRSSFRSGAPPPPLPIKQFYDKLFWFGFDPDSTRATDRTMFGGTRGKFNAMELLRDREFRQRGRRVDTMHGESKMERFDDEEDEDIDYRASRRNLPRGDDDIPFMDVDYDPKFEGRYYEDEKREEEVPRARSLRESYDDEEEFNFEWDESGPRTSQYSDRGRKRDARSRRGGWNLFPNLESKRTQADAYDRFIGLGPRPEEQAYEDDDSIPGRYRRRSGFAYKYNDNVDDDYDDILPFLSNYDPDDYIIDVSKTSKPSAVPHPRPRLSWEERALQMDRVPPKSATAWGPNGRIDLDPQTKAALDAKREIEEINKILENKEELVVDITQQIASLKSDATFYETQIEAHEGRDSTLVKKELGYILRDVEDSSRLLRKVKLERDAALVSLDRLKSKHWALLSEHEAGQYFLSDRI